MCVGSSAWVEEGSGEKAGTSSCLHTLPLPSLGNAANMLFTEKSLDFVGPVAYGHHCTVCVHPVAHRRKMTEL